MGISIRYNAFLRRCNLNFVVLVVWFFWRIAFRFQDPSASLVIIMDVTLSQLNLKTYKWGHLPGCIVTRDKVLKIIFYSSPNNIIIWHARMPVIVKNTQVHSEVFLVPATRRSMSLWTKLTVGTAPAPIVTVLFFEYIFSKTSRGGGSFKGREVRENARSFSS